MMPDNTPSLWSRRRFLAGAARVLPASALLVGKWPLAATEFPVQRQALALAEVSGFARPQTSYGILGWNVFTVPPVGKGEMRSLAPVSAPLHRGSAAFRVTLARDAQSEVDLEVFLAGSGRSVGSVQCPNAKSFQILELPLPGWAMRLGATEGFGLRQWKGTDQLWLFGPPSVASSKVSGFEPHCLFGDDPGGWREYLNRMTSADALDSCGLRIGCLLDGLFALSRAFPKRNFAPTMDTLLRASFVDGRPLWPQQKADALLPYDYFAERGSDFTALPDFVAAALKQYRHGDLVDEPGCVTALAAYSVAYSLTVMATRISDASLLALSLKQFRLRREQLWEGEVLWALRYTDGRREVRNNSRAAAWYALGLAKALDALKDLHGVEDLIAEVRRVGKWAIARQHSSGLWPMTLDQPGTTLDTVASAGLAAALAIAARRGWLGTEARSAATRTLMELSRHLTPDGYLTGALLEEGSVGESAGTDCGISQMGMGLLGLLLAEFPASAEQH